LEVRCYKADARHLNCGRGWRSNLGHNERTFSLAAATVVCLWACATSAQTGGGRPIRNVLALGRVASMVEKPVELTLSRVSISADASVNYLGDQSAIYVVSGALVVTSGNQSQSIQQGDGAFIPSNTKTTLQAGANASAEILQYQLTATNNSAGPTLGAPAVATELRRMAIPSNTLKPGPYEFSLTRVTLSAGASGPKPHTRSGAALYYVLAEGTITIWPAATLDVLSGESRTESRPTGAIQEEPFGFIHTWIPKSDSALVLLQANVSQEGVPEIIFVK
jgi:quercetin dioxygenase-like cupin family protein